MTEYVNLYNAPEGLPRVHDARDREARTSHFDARAELPSRGRFVFSPDLLARAYHRAPRQRLPSVDPR